MTVEEKWNLQTSEEKVGRFERMILGHLDGSCQAFDLEEVMSVGFSKKDRLLCWNAAMNLVEQERVHVIQIHEKNSDDNTRWVIVGFPYRVLNNKEFHPPQGVK